LWYLMTSSFSCPSMYTPFFRVFKHHPSLRSHL
jgi:hypothetical protein